MTAAFQWKIPKAGKLTNVDNKLIDDLRENIPNLIKLMNNQNLNEYIKSVVGFSFDANKYFNDSEPWAVKKNDPLRMKTILYSISEQIKNISILLNPIIPNATDKVLDIMNINKDDISITSIEKNGIINHEKELKNIEILFKKIDSDN